MNIRERIAVQSPCPMSVRRMKDVASGKLCSGCNKIVIDFRKSNTESIVMAMKSQGDQLCGIFYKDQLLGQKEVKFNFWYKTKFVALLVIGLIGFNVSPIQAQEPRKSNDFEQEQLLGKEKKIHRSDLRKMKVGRVKRRGFLKRRRHEKNKNENTFIGCPSF